MTAEISVQIQPLVTGIGGPSEASRQVASAGIVTVNPPSNFLKFAGTSFEHWILPIIPTKAKLKTLQDGKPGIDSKNLGKVPGRYLSREGAWVGFANWSHHRAGKRNLEEWQGWQSAAVPIAIGIQTAEFPVVDIDSDDPSIAEAIHILALTFLGWSPVRCREGSPKRVLCYKWTPGPNRDRRPVSKQRFAFTDKEGKTHAVEILGRGQQVVIEGPHAKGNMHYWLSGKGLTKSYDELVDIGEVEAWRFLNAVRQWVEEQGFVPVRMSLPNSGKASAKAFKIDDPENPNLAKDFGLLARAIKAIDINDPKLDDYDTWCTLFRAMWAACGGDRAFHADHILPWLDGNPQNLEDDMEAKLASFRDSQVGAEHIYRWAAHCGHPEFYEEYRGEYAKAMFDALPDNPADAQGADGSAGGAQGAGGG